MLSGYFNTVVPKVWSERQNPGQVTYEKRKLLGPTPAYWT